MDHPCLSVSSQLGDAYKKGAQLKGTRNDGRTRDPKKCAKEFII